MAIHPAYAQVSALLVAVVILIAGNGLANTLIPLSATAASFPPLSIGLIGSAYFGGMLVGCIAAPRIIARAGHIRAFSAFVAIADGRDAAAPDLRRSGRLGRHPRIHGLLLRGALRHDRKLDARQGRQCRARARARDLPDRALCGQRDRPAGDPADLARLVRAVLDGGGGARAVGAAARLYALRPAEPPPAPRLRFAWLFRISPVGVVGALVSGSANGTFWSLAPVFAERSGLSQGSVASFMTATILGAALVQYPIGRLADRSDRRLIMLGCIAVAVAAQGMLVYHAKSEAIVLIALAAALGASSLALYPLCSSHAQDLAGRANAVEVSSGLLLAYTIGAIVGPTVAAWMMGWIGPEALFIHNGAIHVLFVLFIVWRLWQRPPRQEGRH